MDVDCGWDDFDLASWNQWVRMESVGDFAGDLNYVFSFDVFGEGEELGVGVFDDELGDAVAVADVYECG